MTKLLHNKNRHGKNRCNKNGFSLIAASLVLLVTSPLQAKPQPQEVLSEFSKAKTSSLEYNEDLEKTGWVNPTPSYKDLGLSDEELAELVGDRYMVALHKPQTVEVPFYGEMIRWNGARFSTGVTMMPLSAEEVRKKIIDNDLNNGWRDYIPFVDKSGVVHKSDKHITMEYKVVAKVLFVKAKVSAVYRDVLEDDGSISGTFMYGSAQIFTRRGGVPLIPKRLLSPLPVSNVRRWEFIPISENKSLVVLTDWAEVSNKSGLSKKMSMYNEDMQDHEMSDEELAGPYPSPAMALYALKTVLLKQLGKIPESETRVRDKITVPDIGKTVNKELLEKLLRRHTPAVFVHPPQTIGLEYGNIPFNFVTAVNKIDLPVAQVREYASQSHRMDEYLKQFKFTKLDGGSVDVPDFSTASPDMTGPRVHLLIKLGKGIPGLTSFKIEYWIKHFWESENRLAFEGDGGDIAKIHGAMDWYPALDPSQTLLFTTGASDIGPDAKFPLSLMKLLPGSDVATGIMSNVMSIGRQIPWIEEQLEAGQAESKSQ